MKSIEEFKKEYLNSNLHIESGEYTDITISNAIDDTLEFAQRWNPVEEELPEVNETILCIDSKHRLFLGFYNENAVFEVDNPKSEIIKWRPIELK